MEYFHVSNDQLAEGSKLSPEYGKKMLHPKLYSSSDHFHAQYLREMIIEDFRVAHYPNKPSRLESVYLFDNIGLAVQYKKVQGSKYLYGVEVDNKAIIHRADMRFIDATARKSVKEIHEFADYFFKGDSSNHPFYEVLCIGEVRIHGEIKEHQSC